MKKTMVIGMILAGVLGGFAGVDNVAILFSSQGPDFYADGEPVRDGEVYALVWTPAGATFGGIDADGKAVPPSVVALKAPVAKGGRCPDVLYEIDEGDAKANYPGGTWGVCLLDTRKFKSDADGVIVKDALTGKPVVESWGLNGNPVNGYGEMAANVSVRLGSVGGAPVAEVVASEVPESAKGFKFEKIDFAGDNVLYHVSGSSSNLRYGITAGDRPDDLKPDGTERYGKTGGDLVIIRPRKAGGEFLGLNLIRK